MKHPITHADCQTFSFLTQRWCITRALELIEANPNAAQLVEQAKITGLAQFLSLTKPTPGHVKLIEIQVDLAYAATTDLTKPVLVAQMRSSLGEDLGFMVIDGWHRVYHALAVGITHLPAYLLSAETEQASRIPLPYLRPR